MEDLKYAVQAVIFNEKGEVLAVSRKDNHNDFGLPGGKVEPKDYSFFEAIQREVKEETGLTIYEFDSELVYVKHHEGYMGYTYLIHRYYDEDEFGTEEPHVIKWCDYSEIIKGSFGVWNTEVAESLLSMGFKVNK